MALFIRCFFLRLAVVFVYLQEPSSADKGLPPDPPPPVLDYLYGYPPEKGNVIYTLPSSNELAYPMTIKLVLTNPNPPKFFCKNASNPEFKVMHQHTQLLQNKKNLTFDVDISSEIKRLFVPPSSCKARSTDCSRLCAAVVISNRFGRKQCQTEHWGVREHVQCGKIENIKILQRNKTTVKVGWPVPEHLINSSLKIWKYQIKCKPECGGGKKVKGVRGRYTTSIIRSLKPHMEYTLYVSCLLHNIIVPDPATIKVWTQEDVPLIAPEIEELRWLPLEGSAQNRRTALIVWKEINDTTILRGELLCYKLIIRNMDEQGIPPMNRSIPPDNIRLKIPGLLNANYSFSIKACTRGGCGKQSPNFTLSAFSVDTLANSKKQESRKNTTILWAIGIPALVLLFLIVVIVSVYYICTNKRSPFLPRIDSIEDVKNPPSTENTTDDSEPPKEEYSIVNQAFSASTDHLQLVKGTELQVLQ